MAVGAGVIVGVGAAVGGDEDAGVGVVVGRAVGVVVDGGVVVDVGVAVGVDVVVGVAVDVDVAVDVAVGVDDEGGVLVAVVAGVTSVVVGVTSVVVSVVAAGALDSGAPVLEGVAVSPVVCRSALTGVVSVGVAIFEPVVPHPERTTTSTTAAEIIHFTVLFGSSNGCAVRSKKHLTGSCQVRRTDGRGVETQRRVIRSQSVVHCFKDDLLYAGARFCPVVQ